MKPFRPAEDYIVFCSRPPMLAWLIVSNFAVTVLTPQQRGLWYTPIAVVLLIGVIILTKKRYGFRRNKPTLYERTMR